MSVLQPAWNVVVRTGWLEVPLFEASVATGAFVVWITLFWAVGHTSCGRRSRFHGSASAKASISTSSDQYVVWAGPLYLGVIAVFHAFKAKTRPTNEEIAPSLLRFVVEVALGIVAYDFFFYWIHFALHRSEVLYAKLHAVHHTEAMGPTSTIVHSFADGALQVAVNIAVQVRRGRDRFHARAAAADAKQNKFTLSPYPRVLPPPSRLSRPSSISRRWVGARSTPCAVSRTTSSSPTC